MTQIEGFTSIEKEYPNIRENYWTKGYHVHPHPYTIEYRENNVLGKCACTPILVDSSINILVDFIMRGLGPFLLLIKLLLPLFSPFFV
jgi:hypothetical protein